ncbi:hypothetical protein [Bradyrhizobium sp.]|uniref:hypothetical protein n=1 Tax=Bradyrhizobium sp. TaxID=376 RepID=UPI003C6864E0
MAQLPVFVPRDRSKDGDFQRRRRESIAELLDAVQNAASTQGYPLLQHEQACSGASCMQETSIDGTPSYVE